MPEQALYLAWRPNALRGRHRPGAHHAHPAQLPEKRPRSSRIPLKRAARHRQNDHRAPAGQGCQLRQREDAGLRPCNECAACRSVNEGRYLDLIEIDAATHTGVDDVRDLRDKIAFSPGEGSYKVYIIDEVHRFTGNAFDALLKTLEEPPPHAVFVLATTEIDKVPATIKSRCLPFEFRRVPLLTVADHLQKIAEAEGLHVERQALELIARQGTGSVRDSISLLDQIVTDPAAAITLALAQEVLGTASSDAVRALVDALVRGDAAAGLEVINRAVDAGSDPQQFGQQIVEQLRALLLAQTASAALVVATEEERERYQAQADANRAADMLLRALRKFNEALADDLGGWQPQLALELALVESLAAPTEADFPAPPAASVTPATAARPPQAAPVRNPCPLLPASPRLRRPKGKLRPTLLRLSQQRPRTNSRWSSCRRAGKK